MENYLRSTEMLTTVRSHVPFRERLEQGDGPLQIGGIPDTPNEEAPALRRGLLKSIA